MHPICAVHSGRGAARPWARRRAGALVEVVSRTVRSFTVQGFGLGHLVLTSSTEGDNGKKNNQIWGLFTSREEPVCSEFLIVPGYLLSDTWSRTRAPSPDGVATSPPRVSFHPCFHDTSHSRTTQWQCAADVRAPSTHSATIRLAFPSLTRQHITFHSSMPWIPRPCGC